MVDRNQRPEHGYRQARWSGEPDPRDFRDNRQFAEGRSFSGRASRDGPNRYDREFEDRTSWSRDPQAAQFRRDRDDYQAGYDHAAGDYGQGAEEFGGYGGQAISGAASSRYQTDGERWRDTNAPYGAFEGRGRENQRFGRPADYAYRPHADQEFDEDYLTWRDDQLRRHDRDYGDWRRAQHEQYDNDYRVFRNDRRDTFGRNFHEWRAQRTAPASGIDHEPPEVKIVADGKRLDKN